MDIQIRQLSSQDTAAAQTLAQIMIAAWSSGFRDILPKEIILRYTQPQPCAAMFTHILESGEGTMYLASLNGKPAGLLYWLGESESDARIEALLTIPESWGNGVGAKLMETALADLNASGFHSIHVWPFSENHRAQRFYRKHSFVPSGNSRMGDALEVEFVRCIPGA